MSILSGPATGQAPAAPTSGAPVTGGRSQLSAGVRIVGEFQAPGHVELSGRIEGRVIADSVVVEEQGEIHGEVRAGAVGVKGTLDGTLLGGAVRLHATARVTGTIRYDSLTIESGAEVTADLRRNVVPSMTAAPSALAGAAPAR